MKDVLNRNCCGCGKSLIYKSLTHLKRAEKNSSQCKSCSKSGKNNPLFNKSTLENYENRGRTDLSTNAHHLDHIVSIKVGFIKNISPDIIGDIKNLRFIPARDNCRKSFKSDERDVKRLMEEPL